MTSLHYYNCHFVSVSLDVQPSPYLVLPQYPERYLTTRHRIKMHKWNNQQLTKKVNKTDAQVTESRHGLTHARHYMLATTILKLPSNVDAILPILQMKVLASVKLQSLFKVYRSEGGESWICFKTSLFLILYS